MFKTLRRDGKKQKVSESYLLFPNVLALSLSPLTTPVPAAPSAPRSASEAF